MPKNNFHFDHTEVIHTEPTYIKDYIMSINKYNRTTSILNSSFKLITEFDDDSSLEIEVFGFQGNEYRKFLPTIKFEKVCTKMNEDTIIYPDLVKVSNFPPQGPDFCPFPVNSNYKVENYLLDIENANVPVPFNIRKVKVTMRFYANKILALDVVYYVVAD